MEIREYTPDDKAAVRAVHRDAFGEAEGDTVSQLAIEILEDPTALPLMSLVAVDNGEIIGNIIFSSVSVDEDPAGSGVYILSPMAVSRKWHGQGIGSELIRQGLEQLKRRGGEIVLVLGDPNYYSRSGFHADHELEAPHPLPYPEAWMAQELVEGALDNSRGVVQCCDCLNAPEHW